MRELYKNSRHELSKWKEILEPNKPVLNVTNKSKFRGFFQCIQFYTTKMFNFGRRQFHIFGPPLSTP
ncbi:unnamed protein product [Rotaria sp. Silwood2]|nr:unnamed protein product [Rotaria sp. Silwood2]CAF4243782.1 unnamed protein product [Rotaria sp. Silwood2]CAF4480254.1 unnamed protein product [Rotaria sp. Silwood2]